MNCLLSKHGLNVPEVKGHMNQFDFELQYNGPVNYISIILNHLTEIFWHSIYKIFSLILDENS